MATTALKLLTRALATCAANAYHDEFDEAPIRGEAGDWGALAWVGDLRKLEAAGATPEDLDDLWPVYVAAFYGD